MQAGDLGEIIRRHTYMRTVFQMDREWKDGEYLVSSDYLFSRYTDLYRSIGINAIIGENTILASVNLPKSSKKEYREDWHETVIVKNQKPLQFIRLEQLVGIMSPDIVLATQDWMLTYGADSEDNVLISPCLDPSNHYLEPADSEDFSFQTLL